MSHFGKPGKDRFPPITRIKIQIASRVFSGMATIFPRIIRMEIQSPGGSGYILTINVKMKLQLQINAILLSNRNACIIFPDHELNGSGFGYFF